MLQPPGRFVDVALVATLLIRRYCLLGEFGQVDESVASHAAGGSAEGPNNPVDVEHVPCLAVDDDLRADLEHGDEVLIGDLIPPRRGRAWCRLQER